MNKTKIHVTYVTKLLVLPLQGFDKFASCVTYVILDSCVSAGLHCYEWGVWQMLRGGVSFVVVMHVSDLLFIMIYITSFICNIYQGEVRCDGMSHMYDEIMSGQELCGESERVTSVKRVFLMLHI